MTDFIITYNYTEQMIEETHITANSFNLILYHILGKWLLPIFTGCFTVLTIIMRTQLLTTLSLLGLVMLFIIHLSKSYMLQIQKARMCLIHGGELPHITCTINTCTKQLELIPQKSVTSTLDLHDIKYTIVTSQLIIFLFKGQLCIPIPKQDFQQGTAEDLLFWFEQNFPTVKISYR